jgi:hypothetical protein
LHCQGGAERLKTPHHPQRRDPACRFPRPRFRSCRFAAAPTRRRFVDLPYRLHRDNPNWVPPLRRDVRQILDPRRNPFFDHGEACFWLAWRNGDVVGRISAQINRLHLETHGDGTGHFGCLEAVDDATVFAALLGAAEDWLRAREMRQMVGPYSLSINDELGILVDGFLTPPMVGMTYCPPYYAERIAAAGYAKAKDVYALELHATATKNSRMAEFERIVAPLCETGRISLRTLNRAKFAEDLRSAIDIYNDAWRGNWGFVPVTEREAGLLIKQLAPVLPEQAVVFALADGELAGMGVGLPNMNELTADLRGRLLPLGWLKLLWRLRFRRPRTARLILLGLRQRYRSSALGTAILGLLASELVRGMQLLNVEMIEFSWVLEDNKVALDNSRAIGAEIAKTYRLFGKAL